MKNNKKRNNSLFALEKGLFGNKTSTPKCHQPTKQQQKQQKQQKQPQEQARAFDFDDAIELQYSGEAFPSATPEVMSFPSRNSFASELEDESLPFTVEAFETDEEVIPISKPVTPQPQIPLQPENKQEVTSEQMEVQPVTATVVPPSETPLQSARPIQQPSKFESTDSESSDTQGFAADLQAIINGEKTYDTEQKEVVSASSSAPPTPPPTSHPHDIFDRGQTAMPSQQLAEPEPRQMSRSHAVFDQMGQNMAHATNFNQGTVDLALEQSFDEFDRILDQQAQEMTVQSTSPNEEDFNTGEEEILEAKEMSEPLELAKSELPSDQNLMTQALETKKTSSPSQKSEKPISDEEEDFEEMIPIEVWF